MIIFFQIERNETLGICWRTSSCIAVIHSLCCWTKWSLHSRQGYSIAFILSFSFRGSWYHQWSTKTGRGDRELIFFNWIFNENVIFSVYTILDWDLPENSFLTVIGVLFFVVLVTFIAYGMFRLRVFLYESFAEVKCYGLCWVRHPHKMISFLLP